MRYVIDGFLQSKLIEFKIIERERKLLEFIGFVSAGNKTIREEFNGKSYVWFNYSKFIAEYPYLEIPNTKQVGKHVKTLADKGILHLHTETTPRGTFTYVAYADNFYTMLSSNPNNYNPLPMTDNLPEETQQPEPLRPEAESVDPLRLEAHRIEPVSVAETKQKRTHKNQPTKNQPTINLPTTFMSLSEPEQAVVLEWLQYKNERKQGYKQTGLNNLMDSIVENKARGCNLIEAIKRTMSSNWSGIVFDKGYPEAGRHAKPQSTNEALKRCNSQDFSEAF